MCLSVFVRSQQKSVKPLFPACHEPFCKLADYMSYVNKGILHEAFLPSGMKRMFT